MTPLSPSKVSPISFGTPQNLSASPSGGGSLLQAFGTRSGHKDRN
jgi:hypothetical protein